MSFNILTNIENTSFFIFFLMFDLHLNNLLHQGVKYHKLY